MPRRCRKGPQEEEEKPSQHGKECPWQHGAVRESAEEGEGWFMI